MYFLFLVAIVSASVVQCSDEDCGVIAVLQVQKCFIQCSAV